MKKTNKEKRKAKQSNKKERINYRRKTPLLDRRAPSLEEKPTILIVCGGENTEPSYFNQFRLTSVKIEIISKARDPLSLVEKASFKMKAEKYDQAWVVFDKDEYTDENFNDAILKANANGIGVAYSNQAFEYWLLLHLNDHQGGGMKRKDYGPKIDQLLRSYSLSYDYRTRKIIDEELFDFLNAFDPKGGMSRCEIAIKRAKRNYAEFDHSSPATEESSTTVFMLVEELLKYI